MKGLKLKSLLLLVTWGAVLAANGVEAQGMDSSVAIIYLRIIGELFMTILHSRHFERNSS